MGDRYRKLPPNTFPRPPGASCRPRPRRGRKPRGQPAAAGRPGRAKGQGEEEEEEEGEDGRGPADSDGDVGGDWAGADGSESSEAEVVRAMREPLPPPPVFDPWAGRAPAECGLDDWDDPWGTRMPARAAGTAGGPVADDSESGGV